jgi:DNA invertase Pin-like site-specific DNA recombinase
VGLFSSYANELRKARRHLSTEPARELSQANGRRKRKTQPRLSDKKVGQIVTAYETGKTVYELAAEYGCHRVTISAVLKRRGVALRRMPPSDEQVAEMIRLYETGLSLSKVGEHLGFSATTVLRRIRAAGRTTRNLDPAMKINGAYSQ